LLPHPVRATVIVRSAQRIRHNTVVFFMVSFTFPFDV
jgi:hypothetical protein